MREDVQGFRWPRSFQEQPRLLRRRPLTGVVVSQSMSIKRQCEGSGSATSSCADLRAAYHNCFNRWYSEKRRTLRLRVVEVQSSLLCMALIFVHSSMKAARDNNQDWLHCRWYA